MLSISQFKTQYNTIKENALDQEYENISCNETMLSSFLDYFSSKFPETTKIFSKLDFPALKKFCVESLLLSLEEGEGLFKKNEPCDHYYFILFGDINLYEEECSKSGKLLKTISAGTLYGHKIKSTFNYFAIAKNSTLYIKISKIKFEEIINDTNIRKLEFKSFFLKKFFPKLRMYSDDVLTSLKPFFIREQFEKDSKIIVDGEYDEFVYVVIKGQVAFVKSTRRIKNLQNTARRWVILETLSRGDVFGAFSALKHNKNNYTVRVLSEKAEVYKISKAHCLFYFGGSAGVIPEALKGIDSIQQVSINFKLNYLESTPNDMISPHVNFIYHDSYEQALKRTIDETEIDNSIKDAWKDLENLGSKISEFKNNLLKNNLGSKNSADIFSKMKSQDGDVEMKDHTKIMGFATNRVVSKGINKSGLSAVQLKGMSKLQNICGVKKPEEKKDNNENSALIEKLSHKTEDCSKNKLTADFEEENKSEKNKILGRIEIDNVSLNSIKTSDSASTSDSLVTNNSNISGGIDGAGRNEGPKKPVNKKGFSLKNLI